MSALKLAHGMVGDWSKIAVIDTERGSASLYDSLGAFNTIKLEPPFTPENYIEAIQECEQAGMEIIIVDSISHEWEGRGGCLELVEELGKGMKNSFAAWGKITPRHNHFIDAIIGSKSHVIACGRSKQDYVLNQIEKNGRVLNVPEKIGLKAVTREGFDYEMTLAFDIMISHFASSAKDRTGLFMDKPEFVISEDTGKLIKEWCESGLDSLEEIEAKTKADLRKKLSDIMAEIGGTEDWLVKTAGKPMNNMSIKMLESLIIQLEKIREKKEAEKVLSRTEKDTAEEVKKDEEIPIIEEEQIKKSKKVVTAPKTDGK